jgi:hypothetical protein
LAYQPVSAQEILLKNMKNIISSTTYDSSLEEIIAQISKNESIVGVMQIGSLSRNQIKSESDYDLVFILDEAVKSWYVGVTQIDNRFTDLIFVISSEIERILNLDAPVTQDNDLVPIIRWIEDGEILFSRSKLLQQAQEKVKNQNWIEQIDDEAVYGAWFSINFNLAQLRRMLSSSDPLYEQAVDIRMAVYGYSDIWFGYFTIRKIEFSGDKAAIRYLWEHDPEFLVAYQHFINSNNDIDEKFAAYEKVASLVMAPLGGVWPENATVMNVEDTLEIWQRLLGHEN